MHSAPAFTLVLSPDRLWRRLHLGLTSLSLLTLASWLTWHGRVRANSADLLPGLPTAGLAAAAALVTVAFAVRLLLRVATNTSGQAGSLIWLSDQGLWQFGDDPPSVGRVDCVVDLGDWMLLRHTVPTPPGACGRRSWPKTGWLPLSRCDHPAHWHALRCAVFSPGVPQQAKAAPHER